MRAGALALALALALAGVARADEQTFYHAAALEKDGKLAEAIAELQGIVERTPQDAFADDALLEMARINEEGLGQPLRAAETYERLARDYPGSRLATRASRRAETLRAAMGPDARYAQTVVELNAIFLSAAGQARAEAIPRMVKLIADNPEMPEAPRATYWLGNALLGDGRPAEALARFAEVRRRWPDSPWAKNAAREEGQAHLDAGDLDAAERAYREAPGGPNALGLAAVGVARGRARLASAAWAVLAVLAAAALASLWLRARTLRPLLRPPVEVLYLLPVALLFAAAGLTENQALSRAIAFVCGGGLVVAWLSGAALEAARPASARRVVAHIVAAAAAVACVCWIALTRERLVDFLLETLRFGPER